jgi:TrmH family RNA methyltransferase
MASPSALGAHHPRLERVRELQSARGRREHGHFIIEGPTLLAEAIRSGLAPREIFVTTQGLAEHGSAVDAVPPGAELFLIADNVFGRLSDLETPTGILAVVDTRLASLTAILGRPGPVLLLAGVNDPGNAGTLLRSAEAFGAAGVLFGRGGVDPYNPKVVRSAMGSLFRLPLAVVEAQELLEKAAAVGRPVVAADLSGEDVRAEPPPVNAILAVGNERRGVGDWLPRWDRAVRIPQAEQTESLNAAVAGSILLYELARGALALSSTCQAAEKA